MKYVRHCKGPVVSINSQIGPLTQRFRELVFNKQDQTQLLCSPSDVDCSIRGGGGGGFNSRVLFAHDTITTFIRL